MVTSINTASTNPLLAYQMSPITPIAPLPGNAENDPAAQQQSALEARIQSFENYLNGQTGEVSDASAANTGSSSPVLTELEAQIQNFEAYLNQQSGFQPAVDPTASQQPASDSTDQSSGTSGRNASAPTSKPIDLGAVVNALERYLAKQGLAALNDPIQSQSSLPIPDFQALRGRQDPLPVDGSEQAAKTTSQQSVDKRQAFNRELNRFLDDVALLNLVANKKTLEFDPVRDLENKSTYKPPGESSPI